MDARRACAPRPRCARSGVSVEYALREQALMKQVKAAKSAGAEFVLTLHDRERHARPHAWTPDAPPEWDRLLDDIDLYDSYAHVNG